MYISKYERVENKNIIKKYDDDDAREREREREREDEVVL